ncbi:MAG: methyltransferase domain-containing protein [Armatimonas sp.]
MTNWDSLYQAGDAPWDKGTPAPPLIDWLTRNDIKGRWLVPGCGRGHDARTLAEEGASVVALDLSPTAIEEARNLQGSGGLQESQGIEWVVGDLFALPAEFDEAFDGVFEHTCFCAIPRDRRDDYVQAVYKALKPGGELLAIFYLSPRDDPDPNLGPPFNATIDELDARFDPYFILDFEETPAVAYPGRERRERLRLYRKRTVH